MKRSLLLLACVATGCLSSHQNSTLDGIESRLSAGAVKSTFVEAYVEYTGPQKKWAGSPSFILHIQARENEGEAKIWVTPPLFYEEAYSRAPASEHGTAGKDIPKKVFIIQARARLAELANAIQSQPLAAEFKGCLYPVRAWVIKADGGIVEDRACRGQQGWVKKANEIVAEAIASSMGG